MALAIARLGIVCVSLETMVLHANFASVLASNETCFTTEEIATIMTSALPTQHTSSMHHMTQLQV
jgi:hypothetical protein